MKAPKSAKTLPQALSVDQTGKLVDIEGDELLTLRDRAILELFYSSGLRLAELTGLDIDDLNLSEETVIVTGKGNKTRIVPMGSHAISAMQDWLKARAGIVKTGKMAKADENAVFITGRDAASAVAPSSTASRNGRSSKASTATCTRICCATVSPAMCCNPAVTCVPCRRCWATPTSALPRCIPTWISSIWPKSTMRPIQGRGKNRARENSGLDLVTAGKVLDIAWLRLKAM